jgi:hypothetical protein
MFLYTGQGISRRVTAFSLKPRREKETFKDLAKEVGLRLRLRRKKADPRVKLPQIDALHRNRLAPRLIRN